MLWYAGKNTAAVAPEKCVAATATELRFLLGLRGLCTDEAVVGVVALVDRSGFTTSPSSAAAPALVVGDAFVELGEHGTLYSSFLARHALNEFTGWVEGRVPGGSVGFVQERERETPHTFVFRIGNSGCVGDV